MEQFARKTFGEESAVGPALEFEVAVGKPAVEILRVARERSCELIVMSTHGLTGMRKLFFGSTTERVLRETTKPVLLTPAADAGPIRLDAARQLIHRILVAVDLSPASLAQARSARRVAEALDVPVLLVHVVEPLKSRIAARLQLAGIEADRRAVGEEGLAELLAMLPSRLQPETLVAYGDPAEEIAKVARDRQTGLIVVGLHGSPLLGPRMGSVTYRLVCVSSTLVLALPPVQTEVKAHDVVGMPVALNHPSF
jgi:nucleotide-binding universal stress UspA family protein